MLNLLIFKGNSFINYFFAKSFYESITSLFYEDILNLLCNLFFDIRLDFLFQGFQVFLLIFSNSLSILFKDFLHEFNEAITIWIWWHSAQLLRISIFEIPLSQNFLLFTLVEGLKIVDDADLVAPFVVLTIESLILNNLFFNI